LNRRAIVAWLASAAVFVLILALPLTAAGSRLLVEILNGLSGLELAYSRGSLAGRLTLSKVVVLQDNIRVELREVELDAANRCLLHSEICLDDLRIERVLIEISEQQSLPAETRQPAQFEFPVAVSSAAVSIDELRVRWPSGELSSVALAGQFEISESRIRIGRLFSDGLELALDTLSPAGPGHRSDTALPRLFLPLDLRVDHLELHNPAWRFNELQQRHRRLELSGRWQGSLLEVTSASLDTELWGEINTAGNIRLSNNWPLEFGGVATADQPPLWPGLHAQELKYALAGDLSQINWEVEMSADQSYQLGGNINVLAAALPFDLSLKASWTDGLSLADIPGLETAPTDLELLSPWVMSASGTLAKQSLSLNGSARGMGYGEVSLGLQAFLQDSVLQLNSGALRDAASDSALELTGEVFFDQGVNWELNVDSSGLDIPAASEFLAGRLRGSLVSRGEVSGTAWQLGFEQLDLRGEIAGSPASAVGYLALDSEGLLHKSELELQVRETRLALSVPVGENPQIELQVDDIGNWLGGGRGALTLSSELSNGQRLLVFRGSAENLEWQELSVDRGRFEGRYQLSGTAGYNLSATLESALYQDISLDTVQLQGRGNRAEAQLNLAAKGDVATDLRVTAHLSGQSWEGQLAPATVVTPAGQWRLGKAVALKMQAFDQLSIDAHCWHSATSHICPGRLTIAEQSQGSLEAAVDLQALRLLVPKDLALAGDAKLSAKASWSADAGLVATGQARLSAGHLARSISGDSQAAIRWDRGTLDIDLAQDISTITADLWREGRSQFSMDLTVSDPLQNHLKGAFSFDDFNLSGTLKPFFPMFSDHSGELSGVMDFSGSLQNPKVHGLLTVSNADFSLVGNPTSFDGLELTLRGQGDRIDLEGELLVGGGQTQVSGSLLLPGVQGRQTLPQPQLELQLRGERQSVLFPPGIEATVSEDLVLTSEAGGEKLALRGEITVHDGVLESEQLPAGSVDISTDVVLVDDRGEVVSEPSLFDLVADVDVTIEEDFLVRGSGVETTVGGQLTLKKASLNPLQLFGELNIVQGEINAFGQQFDVKRGNVAFVGEPDNPDLDLRAERDIPDDKVTVGVHLRGSLEAISFNLYSTPDLPEAEMMSYLIRGRGLDKRADADGAAVALSLGMGAVNRTGVVRELNKIPGISNVSFGTDGDAGDTTATVSGYVGKRLYLSYGAGIYEPINVLTARLYLQSRLWLEVVSSLTSSADIYYSFDIE
jgi:translocation and assembly module TamB